MKQLVLVLFLLSCTHSNNLKINFQSSNIYDVEAENAQLVFFCNEPDEEGDSRQYLSIYLKNEDKIDLFFTRRKLGIKECQDWLKEICGIYDRPQWARLVGLQGKVEDFDDKELKKHLKSERDIKVSSIWFFSRIVTKKGCVGHFGHECSPGYSEKAQFNDP